ncbi:MAG: ATP synthase F1 subunit gamma [bacterium]
MLTLKEYGTKIGRLRSTRKMTRTMKMVSATKLRRTQEIRQKALDYAGPLKNMALRTSAGDPPSHQLMESRRPPRRALVLVLTSDRGLCGAFNNNVNRAVAQWIETNTKKYESIQLSFCGRRGLVYFRRGGNTFKHYEGLMARPSFSAIMAVSEDLQSQFLSGQYDEIYIAYNVFKSVVSRAAVIERFLPIDRQEFGAGAAAGAGEPILDPGRKELWRILVQQMTDLKLYTIFLASLLSEHSARMVSMESATTNADKMITSYTILRNQARQAAITGELMEIVAGAEAMK